MGKKAFTYFLVSFLSIFVVNAQKARSGYNNAVADSSVITFYFNIASAAIDLNIPSNSEQLRSLVKIRDRINEDSLYVYRVDLTSNVSPEGSDEANSKLRWERLRNSVDLIKRYFELPARCETYFDARVTVSQIWSNLAGLVRKTDWPNKQQVISILNAGGDVPTKIKALEPDQKTWNALHDNFFPQIRSCKVVVFFRKKEPEPAFPSSNFKLTEETTIKVSELKERPQKEQVAEEKAEKPKKEVIEKPKKPLPKKQRTLIIYNPLLAVGTNVLYDVAITPNVFVEVPVKDKMSFALMGLTSWWKKQDDSWCYEFQYAELEGKRWLGDRSYVNVMTGHALGLYAGIGYYDMEAHSKGFQGEVKFQAGISYHYSKYFGSTERWRFQFGFGIGAARLNYSYYEGRQNNKYLVWQYDGKRTYVGPTKLELSLSYLIHTKKVIPIKEKGGEKDE